MNCIDIKRTTTTQIKKATISNGKFYVDGEERGLLELLSDTFVDSIFDMSITEKVELE